jgi:hypothetical protein
VTSAEGQRATPTCTRTPGPLAPCPPETEAEAWSQEVAGSAAHEARLWCMTQLTDLRQIIDGYLDELRDDDAVERQS